jgi:outer membrane protein TolC
MKNTLIAAALLLVGSAYAATNDFLTWEQCLELTKSQSPELVAARSAVRELEYGVASASAGFLPEVDASAGINRGQRESDRSQTTITGGVTNTFMITEWGDADSVSAGIDISQDLFSGGGNLAKRKRAQAQLRIGNEQYRGTLSDVELRLRLAFVEVVYAQDLIELTEQIAKRRENNVKLIQLRFDGGRENAGSLERSKAQLAVAKFEVRQAERALTYALRNLAAAMGQMDLANGAVGELRAKTPDELSDLLGLMKQTPDYEIAATQVESSRQGMKVTRSGRFPTVSFNASTGFRGDRELDLRDWSVGFRANMKLFTGNRLRSDVAAEKEKVIQSEMDLMDTANSLMATLQQRWNNYMDAVENEATQKQSLDAEMLRAEISTAKYKQGLLSFEDWDIIESNLINQGKTYLQRRRTSELEQARWKNALGLSEWYTEKGE